MIGFLFFSDEACCSLVGLGMELASLNGDKECESRRGRRRRREEANGSFVRAILLLFYFRNGEKKSYLYNKRGRDWEGKKNEKVPN